MVAYAAPETPMPNFAMKRISSPTFMAEDIIRNTRGVMLSPTALRTPADIL